MGKQPVEIVPRQSRQQAVLAGNVDSAAFRQWTPPRRGRIRGRSAAPGPRPSFSVPLSQKNSCGHVGNRTDAFFLTTEKEILLSAGRQTDHPTEHRCGTNRAGNRPTRVPFSAPRERHLRGAGGGSRWPKAPE